MLNNKPVHEAKKALRKEIKKRDAERNSDPENGCLSSRAESGGCLSSFAERGDDDLGSRASVAEVARDLCSRIELLPEFASARTVALYCALPDEAPTVWMLARWFGSKRLALPVIDGDDMHFREYTGDGCLRRGAFGILEPDTTDEASLPGGHFGQCNSSPSSRANVAGAQTTIPPEEIDLMLVPGMAFDARGGRLGRGKGFYDRYLSRPEAAHIYKVGVCLPHRFIAEVPTEPHDIVMDAVKF